MCRSSWRCVFLDVGHLAERIPLKRAPLRERESPANGRASRAWTSSGARAARLGEPGAGPGLGPGARAGGKLAWRINRFAGSAPRGVRDARRRLLRTDNTHVDLLVVDGIASFSLPLSSSFLFYFGRIECPEISSPERFASGKKEITAGERNRVIPGNEGVRVQHKLLLAPFFIFFLTEPAMHRLFLTFLAIDYP